MRLNEISQTDPFDDFLQAVDFWCGEVQGDDFEHGHKLEAIEWLMKHEDIARSFTDLQGMRSLYRGTRGISRQKAAAARRLKKSVTFDMTESSLSSWSTNMEVAQSFAREIQGVVIVMPTRNLDIFLSMSALYAAITPIDRKRYPAIRIGAEEKEVLVKHPDQLTIEWQQLLRA